MTRQTKQLLAAFHWILGIIILLPLLIATVSGTALIFREEMETYFEADLYHVEPQDTPQPIDSLTATVEQHTNTPISYLLLPEEQERSAEYVLVNDTVVFVNPYTAKVLGDRHLYGGPAGWLYNLHSRLFSGRTGEIVLGSMGIAVILLFFSGLATWLWHKQPFRRKFQIKFSGSNRRTNYDLHRVGGIFAGTLLALSAVTGTGLIFYNTFSGFTHTLAKESPPEYPVLSTSGNPAQTFSADKAAETAQEVMPEAELKRIVWPTSTNKVTQLRFRQQDEVHPNGMSMVYLDSIEYSIVSMQKADEASFPVNLNYWLYPLHSGQWGWWDLILILTGAGGLLLVTTGFLNVKNMKWK